MSEEQIYHSLYGGSSADTWSQCYGWASLVKDLPSEPPGIPALRGTALHYGVLEIRTAKEIEHRVSGADLIFDYSGIPNWPDEGEELAHEFWNYLWERVLEKIVTGKTIMIEKRLTLFEDLDSSGIADLVVLYYNDKGKLVAVIVDCKFGKVRQGPDKEQFKFLHTALYKQVKEQKGKLIDEFRSFVYQPTHTEDPFSEHRFTRSEIEKAAQKYEKAIVESKKDNPKFKVGDHCFYCKAQGRCIAYRKKMEDEMEVAVIRNRDTVSLAPIETLSPETKAKIALFGDKLTKYISNVKKDVMLSFINNTAEVPELKKHLKVVEGRSNRVIKDESLVIAEFQKLGLNPFKDPELKGLGKLEDTLVQIGKKKAEAKKYVDTFTEKPPGKPKITTIDSDKPDYIFIDGATLLDDYDDSEY